MIYLKEGNTPLNEARADEIYQEGNSTYQLTFKYPLNNDKWKLLTEETKLISDDLDGEQEFTIFEVVKEQGYITVYANQVATLLNYYSIGSINVDRVAGNVVMTALAGAILRDCPFSFYSDITDKHTFNAANISAMDALIKEKHSIVGQWGGDLVREKYQVSLFKNGGSETEALFMYKKNMKSTQQTTSTKELRTRIHFRKKIEVGEGDSKKEQWLRVTVDSPLINKYKHIYEADMEVTDEDVKDLASLTKYGEQYYRTTLCDMIEDSLELDVAGIGDVPVKIFDIVSVYHEQFEIDVRKKITKYRYSPMGKKLKSVGFGTIQQTLGGALNAMVSDSVKTETAIIEQNFEVKLEKELKNADKVFDQKMNQMEQSLSDGIEQAKAKAEEVKAVMTDQLNLKINQSKSEVTDRLQKEFNQKLSSASADLAGVRANLTQAQSRLSGDISQIRSDVGNIRTKQGQHETEIGKQVQALNAAKTELAGVKSAQATFEQTTTRRLAELANVADGKASKSELTQTAEELSSKIASVQAGSSRNYFRNSRSRSFTTNEQAIYDYRLFIAPDFWKNKDRLKRDYVRLSFDVTFPVALARDMPAMVHFGATPWYSYKNLVFKGGTTERQHFEFTINLSSAAETYQTNNVFIRFGTNYGFPSGFQVVIENAMLSVGNYYPAYQPAYEDQDERVSAVESSFKQRADLLEASVSSLREGLNTKADSSALTLLSDRILASVKSLETDTQNKLNSKLSTAEFEVRAGSIRQEILNATKDKADKALVTAEAGKLREELASLSVGENLFINSEFKNLRDNGQRYTANGKTYQNMIAPYWYNPYNAGIPNAQNIQHGYFDTSMSSDTVFAFNESDGSRHWKALSTDFKIGVISAGEYYFSADLYATDLGTHIKFGFYYHNSTGKLNFYAGQTKIEVSEKGRWVRLGAPLKVNDDIDLTKKVLFYIYGYNFSTNSILYLKKPKVSKGRLKSDWSPALEDTEGLITEAKATFERTAQGLRTDLSAVQAYVNADNTRAEALRTYSREETARQLTAERKLIEAGYVGIAQHTEDVRSISRRFEELKSSSDTKLAEFKQGIDGQFATMSSQIGESLKKTDISITPGQIVLGTGKVVNGQTLASLFVQNPESMQAITKLMRITGDLIVDGSITGRDLAAGAITTPHLAAGAVTAEVLGANAVTADKVKADDALLEKLTAGEALLRKLMAKDAFINRLQSIDFTAEQVKGGMLRSIDGSLIFDLNKNTLTMSSNTAAIKRVLPGHPTQFIRYETERKNNVDYTRTIIGSNRNGSDKFNSATFAGLVVENSNQAGIEDSLRLYGDNTYFRHAQGDVGWNVNAVTQRFVPATWDKESEIWATHFVAPDKNKKFVRLDTSIAALWDIWNHIAYNGFNFQMGALQGLIRSRIQAWRFEGKL